MRIKNTTSHLIQLPPIPGYESGPRLMPGQNEIPDGYLDALKNPQQGQPDHRLYWEELLGCTRVVRGQEVRYPAQLEILAKSAKVEAVEPADLADKPVEAAKAWIDMTDDLKVLNRWARDKRPEVADAAKEKIADLKGRP